MKKFFTSLQTKLVISFLLLILVITGGTFLITNTQSKKALLDSTRDDMLQTVALVSTQFTAADLQTLSGFKAGDDGSPAYLSMIRRLRDMRSLSPNMVNFYIMSIAGNNISFVVDDAVSGPALVGDVYTDPDPRLFDAVAAPSVSDNFYTDAWGTFISAYAPLKDANGNTAFVVGGDMDASQVITRQNFIGTTIYYIMAGAILFAGFMIAIFSVTIIKDIKKLDKTADEISKGNTKVSVDVHRSDEIGDLADSFGRMVASLKIMMDMDEQPGVNSSFLELDGLL